MAWSKMPTHPADDPDFMKLPDGRNLASVKVNAEPLTLAKGVGRSFCDSEAAAYEKLKRETQTNVNSRVQWVFADLDNYTILSQSADAGRKVFGASVAKVFVAATLNNQQNAFLSDYQFQLLADMLVVSSNTAWTTLQAQIGSGNSNDGRARIHQFTQSMAYYRTRGFQGWWGDVHGNELVATELVHFLYDTYHARYAGAETVWKLIHTERLGNTRANKYLPQNIFVGGKTGVYDGATVDPETGSTTNPDGTPYTVRVRNHLMAFNYKGREYAIAVLANNGLEESSALLAGGLFREYAMKKKSRNRLRRSECRASRM